MALAVALLLLKRASSERRLIPFLLTATALLAVAWIAAMVVISLDETGAGGAFDCWPGCSIYQQVIHLAVVVPPALLLILTVSALTLSAARRWRRRGEKRSADFR